MKRTRLIVGGVFGALFLAAALVDGFADVCLDGYSERWIAILGLALTQLQSLNALFRRGATVVFLDLCRSLFGIALALVGFAVGVGTSLKALDIWCRTFVASVALASLLWVAVELAVYSYLTEEALDADADRDGEKPSCFCGCNAPLRA